MSIRLIGLVVSVILIAALGAYFAPTLQTSSSEAEVRRLADEFGAQLSPSRFDIARIVESGDHYRVEGSIVEFSSEGSGIGEAPTEAVRRPVMLVVQQSSNGWEVGTVRVVPSPGDTNWEYTVADVEGKQWLYPRTLPTHYVSVAPDGWPPSVTIEAAVYTCEGEEIAIDDRLLCLTKENDAAVGSMYTTYRYRIAQGDAVVGTQFTLRFPQCLNYDEPQQSECAFEQASFDVNSLADRILSSVRR